MHVILYQFFSQYAPLIFHFNVRLQNITIACIASISWTISNVNDSFIHSEFMHILSNIVEVVLFFPLVVFNEHVVQDCTSKHDIVNSSLVLNQHVILLYVPPFLEYVECALCIFSHRFQSLTKADTSLL